jgi:hypothetical protein
METRDLIKALTVPFVAGFIVQRFLEILDTCTTSKLGPSLKKFVMGLLSLALGWMLAGVGHIAIFSALKWQMPYGWDIFFSGIFISAGTEGFNSVMKFANYKKEASKADAASKKSQVTPDQLRSVNP